MARSVSGLSCVQEHRQAYRLALWQHLDDTGQRCGHTFTVDETPRFASWATGYLYDVAPSTRHFVITTMDDVVEVLSANEPTWATAAESAGPDRAVAGKAEHLYFGEDDAAIERLSAELRGMKKNPEVK